MNKWIKAFRMRTLPLAVSSILMGGFVAIEEGYRNSNVLLFAVITTLLLQILSNLANDYGDFVKGTDNKERLGPTRSMQSGEISKPKMLSALVIFISLSLISGVYLVYISFAADNLLKSLLFIVVGILAILAAIRYTMGSSAYGYSGMGDFFVFIFFGWVAVLGTYFLISSHFDFFVFLPASTMGLFSAAILNLNNLRDHKNDSASGKRTMVVKMSYPKAKHYHSFLIVSAWILFTLYLIVFVQEAYSFLVFLSLPFFINNMLVVYKEKNEQMLDPELKKLALSITFFTLLFGLGIYLS